MFSFSCLNILRKSCCNIIRDSSFSCKYVGIIGVPFGKGQPIEGVEKGPDALRNHGLINELKKLGLDVKDYGNLVFEMLDSRSTNSKVKFSRTVSAACQKVSSAVKKILLDGRKCITLGGDHSLGLGTVHGHSQVHDVCLLWIDAHADINTPYTTHTGHFHGMPCSFLVKELKKYSIGFPGFDYFSPCLNKYNLAYIGLRDIDPLEKYLLVKEGIQHFTMRDVDKLGIHEIISRSLQLINPTGKLSLHVSFDIDSIDKLIASSTGTPVLGGLTVREAITIAEEVSNIDGFRGFDLVEVNPSVGNEHQVEATLDVAVAITKAFFGQKRHGYVPEYICDIPTS